VEADMDMKNYPIFEHGLCENINALMKEWQSREGEIITDGFYPFYTKQKYKILFIGREAYTFYYPDYIDRYLQVYKDGSSEQAFHRRLRYIAYGVNHDFMEWNDIPYIKEIGETFASSSGISFAFMNLCKISNESGNADSDIPVQNEFVKKHHDLIRREIELLAPDIIITCNISDRRLPNGDIIYNLLFPGHSYEFHTKNSDVCACTTYISGKKTALLDAWHFSAIKPDAESFYYPICEAIKRLYDIKTPLI
jgi:hypothetical protein